MQKNFLVLDASCPTIQVAIFRDHKMLDHCASNANAMDKLLSSVETLLKSNGLTVSDIDSFGYCSGPGSILGIRLSIIAIKTWLSIHRKSIEDVFTYESLHIAAYELNKKTNQKDFAVISEWKKGHWNCMEFNCGKKHNEIKVWNLDHIKAFQAPIYLLPQRKIWSKPEIEIPKIEYSLSILESIEARKDLLKPVQNWEMYAPEVKEYAKWSNDRHR